ncbi:hypothetical protein EJ06DRAFT_260707 [Trichodelitschia bisporula]|uniref:Zn(2)-C6 fungal-type domain-containing protein n=1 Tax=Trichodelitschia bisporula TaxID=703511 RepID=A0A6G1HIX0_9PEZI|nr:hypothetical protein EJ06DRAFT_260707 [Trichodelitschia bisporula]
MVLGRLIPFRLIAEATSVSWDREGATIRSVVLWHSMSSPFRPLLPADNNGGHATRSPRRDPAALRKRTVINSACRACRKRKSRCDGKRPVCTTCQNKSSNCEYEIDPGVTRTSALKVKAQRLENELGTMLELYWYLQTKSESEARSLFDRIRAGADLPSVTNMLAGSRELPTLERDGDDEMVDPLSRPTASEHVAEDEASHAKSSDSDETGTPRILMVPSESTLLDVFRIPEAVATLTSAIDTFYLGTGIMFYVMPKTEGYNLLSQFHTEFGGGDGTTLGRMFCEPLDQQSKVLLCELAGMAAVGLQYGRDPIPALRFEGTKAAGTLEFVDSFYMISKHFLEAVIQFDPVRAIRSCALLALFNVIAHSTMALAYADMGLTLADRFGLTQPQQPAAVSQEEWLDRKKILRTLVIIRCWLVATLGYVPANNESKQDISPLGEGSGLEETIQQETAKLLILKSNLLRMLDSFRQLTPTLIMTVREDLNAWHTRMPEWMQLRALVADTVIPPEVRRVIFFVHLFYLSAVTLLSRLVHAVEKNKTQSYSSQATRMAVEEGLMASRTSARILSLLLVEQTVFNKCWLCIFQAYTSSITILYGTTQMILNAFPRKNWERDLILAKRCLEFLRYCREADSVARNFYDIANRHYESVTAAVPETQSTGVETPWIFEAISENSDYLFQSPAGDSGLHKTSRELLMLISHPFVGFRIPESQATPTAMLSGSLARMVNQGESESSIEFKLAWSRQVGAPFNSPGIFRMDESSSSGESSDITGASGDGTPNSMTIDVKTGRFVGAKEPSGWTRLTLSQRL